MIFPKMKDITKREDLLALSGDITIISKSRFVPILLLLLGVAVVVLAFSVDRDAENLSTALLTVGFVVAVIGAVGCIRPGERVVYEPTGEVMTLRKRSHEDCVQLNVEKAIADGDVSAMELLRAEGSTPLMSVCWATRSGKVVVSQLHRYVPYEYKPTMEPMVVIR